MVAVSPFPLLNLSYNALMNVLRNMEIVPIISISILSKRTKNLVKPLNLKAKLFTTGVENDISVYITISDALSLNWKFFIKQNKNKPARINDSPVQLPIPHSVQVVYTKGRERETYEWKKLRIGIKEWIYHLMFVFNLSKIERIWFGEGCDRYDVELLSNTFNDCKQIWMGINCPNAFTQLVLETFLPVKQLLLNTNPYENPEDIHNVFTQNFDYLACGNSFFEFWPHFGLDDMLEINSSKIDFSNLELSNEDVNRFIKHWINGSNPRMKHLEMHFSPERVTNEDLDENVILKGVEYTIVPPEHKRTYKCSVHSIQHIQQIEIEGGFDIKRKEGTTATIVVNDCYLEMFVWQ